MQPRHVSTATSAFSLVELSIVLVILGLLTGGILSGQALIRASELRAVTSEQQRYTTAISSFRDKYFGIPGDLRNATAFWTAGTCPGTNANTTAPAANTCDGDGDGMIEAAEASTSTSNGIFRFWQHLALAGLVEGSYTGVTNDTTYSTTVASTATPNVPKSKLGQATWNAGWLGSVGVADTTYYTANYGNALLFGGGTSALVPTAVLKAEEAWNIDTKMDDGKPDQGAILALESQGSVAGTTGCGNLAASGSALAASSYRLDTSSLNCSLIFKTGY